MGNTGGIPLDSSLVSPEFTVPASRTPFVSFDTNYYFGLSSLDYSTDGGKTWTTEWSDDLSASGSVTVSLPASEKTVSARVRFRRQIDTPNAGAGGGWYIDNVRLGGAWVTPQPGGLVVGRITDGNTSQPVDGAAVALTDGPTQDVTSAPMPGIPGRTGGFYWFFSSLTGQRTVTAAKYPYHSATKKVKLAADRTTEVDLTLHAGRLETSGPISASVAWPRGATRNLTLTNTGDVPLKVKINESASAASGPAWSSTADMPAPGAFMVGGSSHGTVYAGLGSGVDSFVPLASFHAYDPVANTWQRKADAPYAVSAAAGGFIDGKLYVSGGYWVAADYSAIGIETKTQVYNPSTDTWATTTNNPHALAGAGTAVLDGKLYTVGGMSTDDSYHSTVSTYDPKKKNWRTVHPYPKAVNGASCGAIAGKLYCAGGLTSRDGGALGRAVKDAYAYDPHRDTWKRIVDLPIDMHQSAYGVADGRLLLTGGLTANSSVLTNQAYAYDPAMNWWTPLPSAGEARNASIGVIGSHGFYTIGGTNDDAPALTAGSVLSGYNQAEPINVPWVAESRTTLTIQPGRHSTVRVRLSAHDGRPVQPRTLIATLGLGTDGFQVNDTVPVSLTVRAPYTDRR